MICPKCHTANSEEEKFCKNCGFQLSSSRICPECGKTNDSNSKYCKECGTVLTPVNTFRKQIIEENTQKSFFSMYKVPIICALLIILAVGGVAGMAFYNANSGGDDGLNTVIPTDNNNGGFLSDDSGNDPLQAIMKENATNKTVNKTNDADNGKNLTEKVDNKPNITNDSKTLTERLDEKTKNLKNETLNSDAANKVKETKKSLNDSSKVITEKVDKAESKVNSITANANQNKSNNNQSNKTNKTKTDKTSDNKSKNGASIDKSPVSSSDANKSSSSASSLISPNSSDDDNDLDDINDSNDDLNDLADDLNDSNDDANDLVDDLNDSDDENDLNDSDDSDSLNDTDDDNGADDDSLSEIEMEDVPNLAQKVSGTSYSFSTIDYDGKELTKAQCIYIFSEYILNVDKGKSASIEIKDIDEASSPSGEDLSQSIDKSDYLSIANRVHSWMDSHDSVPNYVGVSEVGVADLSPNKMLELFTLATLDYAVTGELPESVEI